MHTKIKFTHSFAFWKLQKKHLPDISIIGHFLPPVVQPVLQAQQHMPTKPIDSKFQTFRDNKSKAQEPGLNSHMTGSKKKIINKTKRIT